MTQQTSCIKVLPTKYLIFNQRCRNEIHFGLKSSQQHVFLFKKSAHTYAIILEWTRWPPLLVIPIAIKFPMAISVRGWRAGNGGKSGKVGLLGHCYNDTREREGPR